MPYCALLVVGRAGRDDPLRVPAVGVDGGAGIEAETTLAQVSFVLFVIRVALYEPDHTLEAQGRARQGSALVDVPAMWCSKWNDECDGVPNC